MRHGERPQAKRDRIPFRERITCSINEACYASSFGRTKLYELIGEGQLETRLVAGRRLVLVNSLLKLLGADGGQEAETAP